MSHSVFPCIIFFFWKLHIVNNVATLKSDSTPLLPDTLFFVPKCLRSGFSEIILQSLFFVVFCHWSFSSGSLIVSWWLDRDLSRISRSPIVAKELCAGWALPSKLSWADYISALVFTSSSHRASRLFRGESFEPFPVFNERMHSPTHVHGLLDSRKCTGIFEVPMNISFPSFSFKALCFV